MSADLVLPGFGRVTFIQLKSIVPKDGSSWKMDAGRLVVRSGGVAQVPLLADCRALDLIASA